MGIRLSVTSFYVFIIAISFTAFKAFFSALFKSFLIFFNEPLQAEKKESQYYYYFFNNICYSI